MLRLVISPCVRHGLVLSLATVLFAGCGKKDHSPQLPDDALSRVPVRVIRVEAKEHVATEDVVGTVRSKLRASIEAKISGRIETMLAAPGLLVKQGDLLAQLDTREIQSRVDQTKAVLKNADADMKRLKSLVAQSAVSQAEYDAAEARFRVAQATAAESETLLGYATIHAPFTGVITRKLADVGDLASPGRTLFDMEDPNALRLEADVPESLIDRIQPGARLKVIASSGEGTDGVVSEIAPAADPATRTFLVKLDLANQGLRAGQFARVAIPLERRMTLRVPASAVVQRGQMELVFVAADGAARLRIVKTGKRFADELEIVSGLAADDRIIVEGAAQLRDGHPIEVKP